MENLISVVIIGVENMDRAVGFYRSLLESEPSMQSPDYSEFKTKGAVLALEKIPSSGEKLPLFTFQSKDSRADFEKMKEKGIVFNKEPKQEAFGIVFEAKDTEGNIFEVVQYKK